MKKLLLILGLVIFLTCIVFANNTTPDFHFVSEADYLLLDEATKSVYVCGMIDMLYNTMEYYEPKLYSEMVEELGDMTIGQFVIMFEKYLVEFPEYLNSSAASSFQAAVIYQL